MQVQRQPFPCFCDVLGFGPLKHNTGSLTTRQNNCCPTHMSLKMCFKMRQNFNEDIYTYSHYIYKHMFIYMYIGYIYIYASMAFVRFALHLELRNILLVQFVVSSYSVMWNICNKNTTKFGISVELLVGSCSRFLCLRMKASTN